jgi:hypothetical protein
MDNSTKQQIIDLLEAMPSGHLLQVHKIRLAGLEAHSLDLLIFGIAHHPETFSTTVALSLIDVLDRPLFPVIFDEMPLYACPEGEVEAMSQAFISMQEDATATYTANMDVLAARFRPSVIGNDDPFRRIVELYAGGRCADIRDVHTEGSEIKFASVALIADSDLSCATWLSAAKGIVKPNVSPQASPLSEA